MKCSKLVVATRLNKIDFGKARLDQACNITGRCIEQACSKGYQAFHVPVLVKKNRNRCMHSEVYYSWSVCVCVCPSLHCFY